MTPDPTTITSLRSRIEALTGPDREVDALIVVATTPTERQPDDLIYLIANFPGAPCPPGTYWRKSRSGASLHTAPPLTASTDAALALVARVLPGLVIRFVRIGLTGLFQVDEAWVVQEDDELDVCGTQPPRQPALAILIVLLTALQESRPNG